MVHECQTSNQTFTLTFPEINVSALNASGQRKISLYKKKRQQLFPDKTDTSFTDLNDGKIRSFNGLEEL